jgi:hypothetical protein
VANDAAFPADRSTVPTSPVMKDAILQAHGHGYDQGSVGVVVTTPKAGLQGARCAKAHAVVGKGTDAGSVIAVCFSDIGNGYTKEPTFTITGDQGRGAATIAELRWPEWSGELSANTSPEGQHFM